ncbi:MAG: polyprenol monophosphomannose synthase [Lentisphaeria bacterium]|nr:polyprenol monophosphomannose synthase [Lentisphaeria bacterium]
MKYSLILPAYNEAESIVKTLDSLLAEKIPSLEILVVDDHSPDGTFSIVEEYGKTHENVHALLHEGDRGLSPSVVWGFDRAQGETLICMDADGQHRSCDLIKLLAEFDDPSLDMAIGSRHVEGGGFTEKWNFFRSLCSKSAALAAKIVLHTDVKDPMSGFFALRRKSFEKVEKFLDPKGFKIMLEICFLLSLCEPHRIRETPIIFAMREAGKSKLSAKVIGEYLAMLFKCFRRRKELKKSLGKQ